MTSSAVSLKEADEKAAVSISNVRASLKQPNLYDKYNDVSQKKRRTKQDRNATTDFKEKNKQTYNNYIRAGHKRNKSNNNSISDNVSLN